jgi:hypothetical protein
MRSDDEDLGDEHVVEDDADVVEEDEAQSDDGDLVLNVLRGDEADRVPPEWIPPFWFAFVLYGPFAKSHWKNVQVMAISAIDVDMVSRKKSDGRLAQRSELAREIGVDRDTSLDRGISVANQVKLAETEARAQEYKLMILRSEMDALKSNMVHVNNMFAQAK